MSIITSLNCLCDLITYVFYSNILMCVSHVQIETKFRRFNESIVNNEVRFFVYEVKINSTNISQLSEFKLHSSSATHELPFFDFASSVQLIAIIFEIRTTLPFFCLIRAMMRRPVSHTQRRLFTQHWNMNILARAFGLITHLNSTLCLRLV